MKYKRAIGVALTRPLRPTIGLWIAVLLLFAGTASAHWNGGAFFPPPLFPPLFPPPMMPLPPLLPPPPVAMPFPGWPQVPQPPQPPPAPVIQGFSRNECINFDFRGTRPSAMLKLRIQRTAPANRKVLYQRALFVLKFDGDALARGTADWMRQEIEHLPAS